MTPVEMAAAVYEREPCARTFKEDLEAHLLNGVVFSREDVFIMGRAVQHDAAYNLIVNPWHVFPVEQQDCWLVYLASIKSVESIQVFFTFEPRPLKYVAWERKNVLRVFNFNRAKRCSFFASALFSSSFCGTRTLR